MSKRLYSVVTECDRCARATTHTVSRTRRSPVAILHCRVCGLATWTPRACVETPDLAMENAK